MQLKPEVAEQVEQMKTTPREDWTDAQNEILEKVQTAAKGMQSTEQSIQLHLETGQPMPSISEVHAGIDAYQDLTGDMNINFSFTPDGHSSNTVSDAEALAAAIGMIVSFFKEFFSGLTGMNSEEEPAFPKPKAEILDEQDERGVSAYAQAAEQIQVFSKMWDDVDRSSVPPPPTNSDGLKR